MGETDLISRREAIEAAIEAADKWDGGYNYERELILTEGLQRLPSVQPDRELIEQLRWERDTAIQQLKELGYGLGEKPRTDDTISRKAAIDVLEERLQANGYSNVALVSELNRSIGYLRQLPSAHPEVIRCKDCRWWDKYDDWDNGYCMAAKHGYWSEHWEIIIRRTYKGDFYCADAEPKGEFDDEVEEEDGEVEQE